MTLEEMRGKVEGLWESTAEGPDALREWFPHFLQGLNQGRIRAAEQREGNWHVNTWVKKGILLGFRWGGLKDYSITGSFPFFDKDTYPLRPTRLEEGVRIVPGGTSIRTGSYVAPGVVIMPPAYVNVGAFVDEGTMIDSHALVGSCAQIGKRVHLSAGSQIGGVLEPVGASPVVIEDDAMIGGNCGIYEGTVVGYRSVIGAGTILTASVPVYDLVRGERLRATPGNPLVIPRGSVVVPGSRAVDTEYGRDHGLSLSCALIVKYRDQKTDARTALEQSLR